MILHTTLIIQRKNRIQKRTVEKGHRASLLAQMVKNLPANAGDSGLIPGLGRSPGEENGYPLQYSCLENSMDRGTTKSWVNWESKERETGKLSAREINNSDDGTPNLVSPKRNTLRECLPYITIKTVLRVDS